MQTQISPPMPSRSLHPFLAVRAPSPNKNLAKNLQMLGLCFIVQMGVGMPDLLRKSLL
jgi:hypothetical protein